MKKVEELTDDELLIRLGLCPECGKELTGSMNGGECEKCGFTHGTLEVLEEAGYFTKCGFCGKDVDFGKNDYCPHCGMYPDDE